MDFKRGSGRVFRQFVLGAGSNNKIDVLAQKIQSFQIRFDWKIPIIFKIY